MPRTGMIRASIVLVVSFLALLAAESASSSFPGTNGRFLFSWIDTSFEEDVAKLATASAAGDDFQVVVDCCVFFFVPPAQWRGDWSPSGRRFAYGTDSDDGGSLVTSRADGTRRKRIWSTASFFRSPAWSPAARRIAVVRQFFPISPRRGDIYIVSRDGTNRIRLTRTRRMESGLDWSSQNRLVFVRRCDLFKMKPNGLRLRRLTHTDACERWPDWSPDGMSLTFERRTGGVSQTWTMRRSGANERLIATGHSPTWAPDGTRIAYISSVDGAIHTVAPSGLGDAVIGNPAGAGESIFGLDWQPRAP
jgi:Tol biopolymer transport system component